MRGRRSASRPALIVPIPSSEPTRLSSLNGELVMTVTEFSARGMPERAEAPLPEARSADLGGAARAQRRRREHGRGVGNPARPRVG